jgi:threonine/homoserine/homoserine lactone efflux protein
MTAMSPSAKRMSFLAIGIVGCLLVATDLVFLIFDQTNLVTYINLFVGLCLIFVGFGSVRALQRQDQKRNSNESRSSAGDASD